MIKNINIVQDSKVLTIRIRLTEKTTPSKEGRLVLATTDGEMQLYGLRLSVLCLQEKKEGTQK